MEEVFSPVIFAPACSREIPYRKSNSANFTFVLLSSTFTSFRSFRFLPEIALPYQSRLNSRKIFDGKEGYHSMITSVLPQAITPSEFATAYGIPQAQVYDAIRKMPENVKFRIGKRIRLLAGPLTVWIEQGGHSAQG